MSAKSYRNKVAEPLVQKLKSLVKTALIRCFEAWDSYYRLNVTNSNLHRENEGLRKINEKLAEDMFSRLVKESSDRQGVTEQLKAENQILWVQKMNNIRACVREVVESEIIYS